jgi:rhodanese-related sulfurtransferase
MPFVGVKMMDCPDLEKLVRNRKPIQLIDVRSKNDFAAIHIRGARSLPFAELAAPHLFRRLHPTKLPICVVSAEGHAQASLAAGMLRSAGCVNAVPLDGGMKDWVARGLPVYRHRVPPKVRAYSARAALSVMAAAAFHEVMVAALLLAIAGILFLKVFPRTRRRENVGLERKQVIRGHRAPNKPLPKTFSEPNSVCPRVV